jgi:transposase
MRRVKCPTCGIRVELVPWADGNSRLTKTFAWRLAASAKKTDWTDVANQFNTSWYNVATAVEMAVKWGLERRDLSGVAAIGIDEISYSKGHNYLTLVYQINGDIKRLLWIGIGRKECTLECFFDWFGEESSNRLEFICTDMWKAYLQVISRRAPNAINILDKFHIIKHINNAIDKIRNDEVIELRIKNLAPLLTKTKWILLKNKENLTEKQTDKLNDLLLYNLKTVKAYILKEDFKKFWSYESVYWAGKFLDDWCSRTNRTNLKPMKAVAKMLKTHQDLILNYFKAKKQFSSGVVEGLNNKAKTVIKRAYGFSTARYLETALFHGLGELPMKKIRPLIK